MKKTLRNVCCMLLIWSCQKEVTTTDKRVFDTKYIDYFWEAFDSIQTTTTYSKQFDYIDRLYTEKGSEELKTLRNRVHFDNDLILTSIEKYPRFWTSIRPKTLKIKERISEVNHYLDQFKKLYPEFKEGPIYLTIGAINSGGIAMEGSVFLTVETLCWDETVDTSELQDEEYIWLKELLEKPRTDAFLYTIIHEYVHIQQKKSNWRVLNRSLAEGAADFITELVLGEKLNSKYIRYGEDHYDEVLSEFRKELFSENWINWIGNGGNHSKHGALGYFMGYAICKAYYEKVTDKKAGIRDILKLDFGNDYDVVDFLNASGIYEEKLINPGSVDFDQTYNITFTVKVPNADDEVYISGSLEELGNWAPDQIKLNKTSDFDRSITLVLPPRFEFKFTRGSWDTEAFLEWKTREAQQRFTAREDSQLNFIIERWKDAN